ncbi:MAG: hypothetical protein ACN6OX_10245 [Pseudomonas sp.]
MIDANGGEAAEGRRLSFTDALHRLTRWDYNEAGLTQQRHNANDTTLTVHWDKLGQLVRLRNENNSERQVATR